MAADPPAARNLPEVPGMVTFLAMTVGVRRQLHHEWAGSPPHRWLLARPRPEGLAAAPPDLRPANRDRGHRILQGEFPFAGTVLQVGAGDPWNRPSPSRRFAVVLHRFGWLRDLLAHGEAGEAEALRLVLEWRRVFGRWNSFAWGAEVLERRVFNLACAVGRLAAGASEAEQAELALDLARQGRHLLSTIEGPVRAAERACAAALAGTALTGQAGEKLTARALARLARALPETVSPDGGHASRSPQAALELMLDLATLDQALVQRGIAPPDEVMGAIDRLAGALRFFTLADGALPAFQGGDEGRPALLAAARAAEDDDGRPPPQARNGYQRLEGGALQLVADAAAPAPGPWSVTACGQPLAIEVLAHGRRLIVGCGWSPEAVGPEALRLVDAASTASLADTPCGEPLRGVRAAVLGPRLVDAYARVEARRHQSDEGLWLDLAHDGWVRRFGLRHERRLFLDSAADELRGEDRFVAASPPAGDRAEARRFIPFVVRFHLHPNVRASLARDRKSVLLRAEGDETGWWLRNDALEVSIEPSVHFQSGQARRTSQIVLRGQARADSGARVRWKLAAAESA